MSAKKLYEDCWALLKENKRERGDENGNNNDSEQGIQQKAEWKQQLFKSTIRFIAELDAWIMTVILRLVSKKIRRWQIQKIVISTLQKLILTTLWQFSEELKNFAEV